MDESKSSETDWTLDLFRRKLAEFVSNPEDLQLRVNNSEKMGGNVASSRPLNRETARVDKVRSTAEVLTNQPAWSQRKITCAFCGGSH